MIDLKKWNDFLYHGGPPLEAPEMIMALVEKFECPRCGRSDLPLALFPAHNKSCAYESAIGMPALEKIEELQQRVTDLEDGLKDAFRTIEWFGGWLSKMDIGYDARGVARVTAEIFRLLHIKEFRCPSCRGRFDLEHLSESGRCKWCHRHT